MSQDSIKKNVIAGIMGATIIQLCTGSTYSWSVFIKALQQDYGITSVEAQFIFAARTAIFAISMPIFGKLLAIYGLRTIAALGSVLFCVGHLIPGLNLSFSFLLTGMGALTGLGISACYMSALRFCATVVPLHKGLIIGIGVGAFGGGAIFTSYLANYLFNRGCSVTYIFIILGLTYGFICFLASMTLPCEDINRDKIGSDKNFLSHLLNNFRLTIGCFCAKLANNFGGLLIIGNMTVLAQAMGLSHACGLGGITVFSVGNSMGRVFWGIIYDKYGYPSILAALIGLSLNLFGFGIVGHIEICFLTLSFLSGFCFGAGFVQYASFIIDVSGSHSIQHIYPFVFAAHGLGALLGPPLGAAFIANGWLYEIFPISGMVVAAGIFIFSFLTFNKETLTISGLKPCRRENNETIAI